MSNIWNLNQVKIIVSDDDNHFLSIEDSSRWAKARWYQKIWGKISNSYKKKFIDIEPLNFNCKGNGTYEVYINEISRTEIDRSWSIIPNDK